MHNFYVKHYIHKGEDVSLPPLYDSSIYVSQSELASLQIFPLYRNISAPGSPHYSNELGTLQASKIMSSLLLYRVITSDPTHMASNVFNPSSYSLENLDPIIISKA